MFKNVQSHLNLILQWVSIVQYNSSVELDNLVLEYIPIVPEAKCCRLILREIAYREMIYAEIEIYYAFIRLEKEGYIKRYSRASENSPYRPLTKVTGRKKTPK